MLFEITEVMKGARKTSSTLKKKKSIENVKHHEALASWGVAPSLEPPPAPKGNNHKADFAELLP